jgi:hypothetical protein
MAQSYYDYFFGPLTSKENCNIFYYIMIINAFFIAIAFVLGIYAFIFTSKFRTLAFFMKYLIILIQLFIVYYIQRIFYTICVKSL